MIITIDGPGNSGKSTVAQIVANKLGYLYLNSGYLYRAIAYLLERSGVDPFHLTVITIGSIGEKISLDLLSYESEDNKPKIMYGNEDITQYLKSCPQIDNYASYVSQNSDVRMLIVSYLRSLARFHDVVIEGRDAGTVIFPTAACKVFLTASLEARTQRWVDMLKQRGVTMTMENAQQELTARDERDVTRETSPLRIPHDAIIIDTTYLTIEQTVTAILAYHSDRKSD